MTNLLARNRQGQHVGVYSLCSAHPVAIRAGVELATERRQLALIEATCNQVNQDGGYTNMQPIDFARDVREAARNAGLAADALILGGDHLGPQPWRSLPALAAMDKASVMARSYVEAGFTKIHLDCSMRCADDPPSLPEDVIAQRAAQLAQVAEAAARVAGTSPVYVIGTEVPPPGGMGDGHDIVPTTAADLEHTWRTHRRAFAVHGLEQAFGRVVAIVVQPGLDFGNEEVVHFEPAAADEISSKLRDVPGAVFEAHSTDYQRPAAYAALVAKQFAILKVGPAATFALREALYALELIEAELVEPDRRSRLRATVEAAMLAAPENWAGHYRGSPAHQAYLRHFSYSDRLRYYWTDPTVGAAVARLAANLGAVQIPMPLFSQYMPQLSDDVADRRVASDMRALCAANVKRALTPYADACGVHAPVD